MKIRILLTLAATFALTQAPRAQQPVAGDRVRLLYKDGTRISGVIDSIAQDGLRMTPEFWSANVFIKYETVASVERSLGRHRRFWRNLGLTMGVAGLGAGVIGAATYSPCTDTGFLACLFAPASRTDAFAMGFVIGGAISLPVGLIIGAGAKHERWAKPVSLRVAGQAVSIRPIVGRRPGVSVTVPFGRAKP